MMVAPDAELGSSQFDVVVFKEIGVLDVDILFKIYSGNLKGERKVQFQKGKKVYAEPVSESDTVLVEADGEIVGKLPASWEIIPSQIWLLYPLQPVSTPK
jgi:diacylglycerol kinase (ATP)